MFFIKITYCWPKVLTFKYIESTNTEYGYYGKFEIRKLAIAK